MVCTTLIIHPHRQADRAKAQQKQSYSARCMQFLFLPARERKATLSVDKNSLSEQVSTTSIVVNNF